MKKKSLIVAAIAMFLVLFAVNMPANAMLGDACSKANYSDPLLCGTPNQNEEVVVQQKVASVLNQVYLWIGIIAVVVIVISGIKYMTSQGNAESVKKAKAGIMYASVGLVVVLAAFAITLVITNSIQGNQVNIAGDAGGVSGGGGGPSTPEVVEVDYIQINPTNAKVMVGEKVKLNVAVIPDYAANRSITYSSSDASIASVDGNGLVTGKKEGSALITAKSSNGKTASATVEVVKVDPPEMAIAKTSLLDEEETTVVLSNYKRVVSYSSSANSVAKVDSNGKVRAKGPGSAYITAKVVDLGGKEVVLKKKVTVRKIKILWVGNSKTYVSDIDQKFSSIVTSLGYDISSTRKASPGATLSEDYSMYESAIKKEYDYVILQEQTDTSLVESSFYSGASKIAQAVKAKNPNVKIYVRKVWYLDESGSSTRSTVNSIATNVARRIGGSTINDGDALYAMRDKGYKVFSDDRHQNALGAYTAAACAASKIFGIDATKITTNAGVSSSNDALKAARQTAKSECFGK